MGYPYAVYEELGDDPAYNFQGKSSRFIELAIDIFGDAFDVKENDKRKKYSNLRSIRRALSHRMLPLARKALMEERSINKQEFNDLFDFINIRIEDIGQYLATPSHD